MALIACAHDAEMDVMVRSGIFNIPLKPLESRYTS